MKEYIFIIIIFIIFIYVFSIEIKDSFQVKNSPHCNFIDKYCNNSAAIDDIKLVVREPINKNETIDLLIDKLVEKFSLNGVIYWRFSLLLSCLIVFFYYIYNYNNKSIPFSNYFFLLVLIWFGSYWGLNHFNFHYLSSYKESAKNIGEAIKEKIKSK